MCSSRTSLLALTALSVAVCSYAATTSSTTSPGVEQLEAVDRAYSNFCLRGRLTRERLYPVDAQESVTSRIEFMRRGQEQRLSVREQGVEDSPELVSVSSPGISFQIARHDDGREEVAFVSPRRGFGQEELREAIFLKAYLCELPRSVASGVSLKELLREGGLRLGEARAVEGSNNVVVPIERLVPPEIVR